MMLMHRQKDINPFSQNRKKKLLHTNVLHCLNKTFLVSTYVILFNRTSPVLSKSTKESERDYLQDGKPEIRPLELPR